VNGAAFYTGEAGPLEQGDLLLAPLVKPLNPEPPEPAGESASVPWERIAQGISSEAAPAYDVLAAAQAAIVVSHGCHLDKQYNQRVGRLHRRDGLPLKEAKRQAEADLSLDRWIVVSPVVSLGSVRADDESIKSNKAVGLFYIPAHPEGIIAQPAVADLGVKFTVDRTLTQRAACLSNQARDELRMALMRADLARRPVWDAVERALNSKLVDVGVDDRNPLRITLRFANGEGFSLVHPPAAETGGGRAEP
jgi:hypothetical protein